MALYAIGDLHLSSNTNKPMSVFGDKWLNHEEKIKNSFSVLTDDDVTVVCGDISWGMNLYECIEDFRFINSLPGKKIILKGNHDYYWSTVSKINEFLSENNFNTISLLHNNAYQYNNVSICGTRGWFYEEEKGIEHDKKIFNRELLRLRASLERAQTEDKIVFLHYPPVFADFRCDEIISILNEYNVKKCLYGHLHGKALKMAFNGWRNSIEFKCVSADYLDFKPLLVIKD